MPHGARPSLSILITNGVLAHRSGTEIFVQQLAEALHARGHQVAIYAPQVGELGLDVSARGVAVFDRIADIPAVPDIIHAHHVGPAMAAIAACPGTPAIFVSHSVQSAHDAIPDHPNILARFAVSTFVRRQRASAAIPATSIGLLPNAVDLARFGLKTLIRERPERAAMIAKLEGGSDLIAAGCEALGLEIVEFGQASGRVSDRLDTVFAEADLVFATGRSALEALACGCAVYLTDGGRAGSLVTPTNIADLADLNFGVAALPRSLTDEDVAEAIRSYSRADIAATATWVRQHRSLDHQVETLETAYRDAIEAGVSEANAGTAMARLIEAYVPSYARRPWIRLAVDVAVPNLRTALQTLADGPALRLSGTDDVMMVSPGHHQFLSGEMCLAWLKTGWWPPESWGTWAHREGRLAALVPPSVSRLCLRYVLSPGLKAATFTARLSRRMQETPTPLTLEVSGGAEGEGLAVVTLPDREDDIAFLEIDCLAPLARSPREATGAPDDRVLGIGLLSIEAMGDAATIPEASPDPSAD